ncbi:HD domain-containing protein [Hominifimenecus sp. rT4P-3]|uniref:HD domain-containing protein n=1 Tax=Hominifimenecus sp. rT4P-3 TaxID=3242979 RepID=UPI003DA45788
MNERLRKQMDFILEIDKQKEIMRQTYLADGSRKEGDAEHAWHMAVMALLLGEYAKEPVDTLHVVSLVLVHDLVEIDAGDTYAYDSAGNTTKKEREEKAASRIFGILPDDQAEQLRGLWEEFERMDTPESRFANALDKIQPILLNAASNGRSWSEHGVCEGQILRRNCRTPEGAPELWDYAKSLIDAFVEKGIIKKDGFSC